MRYVHVEIETCQRPKHEGTVSGDVVAFERTSQATTLVLADGVGSGIKAHMAATVAASRLMELLRVGFSPRQACERLAETSGEAKSARSHEPYVAFTMVRILNDGKATILGYETPPPILVGRHAAVLPCRQSPVGKQMLSEAHCFLEPGDGLLVCSDGITMAGLGLSQRHGWGIEGARTLVDRALKERRPIKELPGRVVAQSQVLWEGVGGDDCTAVMLGCRLGETLNILTGPPRSSGSDRAVVDRFLAQSGTKVVCGATTSEIVARRLDKSLSLRQYDPRERTAIAPPGYEIDGIDLATEGAITLNQVYNILDEDPERLDQDEVGALVTLLRRADRINIFMGTAVNPGHGDIRFSQRGILPRSTIIPLIREKLKQHGKLVVVNTY